MNLTLAIPDAVARKLGASDNDDLARRALEAFAVEEHRAGRLSLADMRILLGFETRNALDGFLKARGIHTEYSLDDLEQERRDLARLGFS